MRSFERREALTAGSPCEVEGADRSRELASVALLGHMTRGPIMSISFTQAPWVLGFERLLQGEEPEVKALFDDVEALKCFFEAFCAEAVRICEDMGLEPSSIPEDISVPRTLALTAMADIREKHLNALGVIRKAHIMRLVHVEHLLDEPEDPTGA